MQNDTPPDSPSAKSVVEAFFAAKEAHDVDALASLFADDIVYIFPLPASGAQENWFVHDGKAATVAYQRRTSEAFSQLIMRDREMTVSEDGRTVFMECRGDYITTDGRPYNNVYMFKFMIERGKIVKTVEYCNPVTYAMLAGLPIAGRDLEHSTPSA